MKLATVLVILQVLLFTNGILGQGAAKSRFRPCNTPTLKNGIVRVRSKGKFARFVCISDTTLHGTATTTCVNGRWEGEIPICVAPGCAELVSPANGTVSYIKRGSGAKLTCNSRYELIGNDEAFCDGIEWDRQIGNCRLTNVSSSLFCDFEGRLKCGWSNYLLNDKDWLHTNMGRHGIGPQHDHTIMTKYEGFFMLLEGDAPRTNTLAYLFSPMYDAKVSNNSCFKFFYHMYGVTTGTIRVYVKTAQQTDYSFFVSIRKTALIEITQRSSNAWIEALVRLPKLGDSFQIVIQGEIMRGQRTDLAIDDVEILDGSACDADRAVVTEKPENEPGGVFDVQSCQNRCGSTTRDSSTSITNNTLICYCYDGCADEDTCCPDYAQFCIFGDTTIDSDIETTTLLDTTSTKPSKPTNTTQRYIPTTTTPKKPTTTAKVVVLPNKTFPKYKPKTTTPESDMAEFDITTSHYMNDDSKTVELLSEKFVRDSEHLAKVRAVETGIPSWVIVTGILFSIMIVGSAAGLYIYRERTRVATPAEMKKRYHCKSANEEFSEIRFLTEDEQLDFTMATPIND